MRLNTAHDLKGEILAALPSYLPRVRTPMPAVAVGIAPVPHGQDYHVAIRVQHETTLPRTARRYLEQVTSGEVDIRITGPVSARSAKLAIGVSTAHAQGQIGTLGYFARKDDGRVGFVSNNHVIAAEDVGVDGDDVLHLNSAGSQRVVARLAGDYPRLRAGPQIVDCAFAQLIDNVDFDPSTIGSGALLSPDPVMPDGHDFVKKIGRTTGMTEGRITAFALNDVVVNYSFGPVRFHDQIEIESLNAHAFSAPGDSGSLIFTNDHHPVALLHAGSAIGGRSNMGLTYANPVTAVLHALGVTLIT